ncbi:single-stranded DNA-binding protein [Nocardioides panaciterrulae]|uniref:Single-strand DNA-binding protein n=1 Tax=Nocardioides panaciterrulae TaxID=661492 RepID=A0A7Y9JAR7_9ACTN|nr:single-stranded DNA-binding protein [Nocardioides panaciterrulae]NYD42007.1 single-strand DNA-binding protein [Nocardioides panaciterrulae]
MSAPKGNRRAAVGTEPCNEVRLAGRVSRAPEERVLPSGDVVWTFRLVVPRAGGRGGSRQSVDVLDCAVWAGRVRRSVATWCEGDQVEVSGALRRRFFRAGGATASRCEVEVSGGRLVRRAGTG